MLPCADIGQLSTRVCVIESYPLLQVELHIYGSSLHRIRVLHVLRPADLLMAGGSTTTMLSADSSIFNAHITARAALSFVADLSQTTHDSEASRGKHSMLSLAQPPHLPPWMNQSASLCGASLPVHVGLLCDSYPSARKFPIAFLPTLPHDNAVGLW